jgi:hypothetical protein
MVRDGAEPAAGLRNAQTRWRLLTMRRTDDRGRDQKRHAAHIVMRGLVPRIQLSHHHE